MDKKDFSNLEDQIMSTVSNALKAIDFANLKIDINYKAEDTLNQFKSRFNGYSEKYMNLNKKLKMMYQHILVKTSWKYIRNTFFIWREWKFIYGSSVLYFYI